MLNPGILLQFGNARTPDLLLGFSNYHGTTEKPMWEDVFLAEHFTLIHVVKRTFYNLTSNTSHANTSRLKVLIK